MKKPVDATPNTLLRQARESLGWTQEELATELGTTAVTVSRWENGVTVPKRYHQRRLSQLYGRSIAELGLLAQERQEQALYALPLAEVAHTNVQSYERGIFFFNEPLPDPRECYGRRREQDILLQRTRRGASTSVIGPRRIGKTWLLNQLRMRAASLFGPRYLLGYIDVTMPSCRTVNGFVAEALGALNLPSEEVDGLISLEKGIKLQRNRGIVPVLAIDEFEGVTNRQEFTLDFFRGMRALTQASGLVLIVLSKQPLSLVVGRDMETSGFFNIFEPILLESFQHAEAHRFITEKSELAGFSNDESAAFWRYGEVGRECWPPLRLQLIGKLLLEERLPETGRDHYWQRFEKRLELLYGEVVY